MFEGLEWICSKVNVPEFIPFAMSDSCSWIENGRRSGLKMVRSRRTIQCGVQDYYWS